MLQANSSRIWKVDLLGTLTLRNSQHHITHFRTHKTAALLGYLACEMRPRQREEIISLLWPDANLENGRNSLSVSLSALRRQLEPSGTELGSVVIADRHLISLNPHAVTVDVQQFRSHLDISRQSPGLDGNTFSNSETGADRLRRLQSGVDLYQGRFLAGLYEDWILREAQHLENLWLHALDQLVEALQEVGDYLEAQRYAERGIAVAPWRETSHRNLISTLIAQGQNELAIRHYQGWVRSANEEVTPPSAQLRALIQTLGQKTPRAEGADEGVEADRLSAADSLRGSSETPSDLALRGSFSSSRHLPLHRTRFFGRRPLLNRLVSNFAPVEDTGKVKSRLTTITGPGGSGKTRLAVEAAQRLRKKFGERVWFVPLTDHSDGSLLDVAVRDSLQLKPRPDKLPLDQIVEFLASDLSLLVLDNFEPLLPLGGALVALLMARLPQLRCLVTSRQRLDLEGEVELHLRPLPVPRATNDNLEVGHLLRFAAIRLFVDRARAARPDFALTRRNAAAVAQLCRSLEGVPLALELAAARSSALSPAQILKQLDSRSDWLQSTQRDLPPRHRSMQAAIDASYCLLPPELQLFFRRQWVFRGGWQPAAAAAICEEPRALHFAAQLRACSMLYQQERAEEVRFSCLETLREFAGDQLESEEKSQLQERHASHFLGCLEAQQPPEARVFNPRTIAQFREDLNNYRSALEWALVSDSLLALRLALALQPWWEALGYLSEGRTQLERALAAAPHAPLEWRGRAYYGAGKLSYQQEFATARALYESSLEIYRELGDLTRIAEVLCALSLLVMNLGEAQAQDMAAEALILARQVGDTDIEFQAAFCLGSILLAADDKASARPLLEGCIDYYHQDQSKNATDLAKSLDTLGMLVWEAGEWDNAKALFEESLQLARQLKHGWLMAHSLWGVATIAREQGNFELSLHHARESVVVTREGQFLWFIPYLIANLAYVELELGWASHAVLLLGAADAHHEILEMPLVPLFIPNHEKYLWKARATLTSTAFETLWQRGRTLSFDQALDLALQPVTLIADWAENANDTL